MGCRRASYRRPSAATRLLSRASKAHPPPYPGPGPLCAGSLCVSRPGARPSRRAHPGSWSGECRTVPAADAAAALLRAEKSDHALSPSALIFSRRFWSPVFHLGSAPAPCPVHRPRREYTTCELPDPPRAVCVWNAASGILQIFVTHPWCLSWSCWIAFASGVQLFNDPMLNG